MTLTGEHIIGFNNISSADTFYSLNPTTNCPMDIAVGNASVATMEHAVEHAHQAYQTYKNTDIKTRAAFLRTVASELQAVGDDIVSIATQETGLPDARIQGELGRTVGQFTAFADYIERGLHLDARIETAQPDRSPLPKPDIRSVNQPMGVVGVFGASNFPLAFSAAGGDTASALASGCTVVVRGHNGHPLTSEVVARALQSACKKCHMPDGTFSLVQGIRYDISYALVEHPLVQAVGFTGSTFVGRILFDKASSRPTPIPFYGELGSINPVVLSPSALKNKGAHIATGFAGSVTLGCGQFCTNPGLGIGLAGDDLNAFVDTLKSAGANTPEQTMLMPKIAKAYHKGLDTMQQHSEVTTVHADTASGTNTGAFNLFQVSGADFVKNGDLQNEIFGPTTMIVACADMTELRAVLNSLHGQLTGTIWMDDSDTDFADGVLGILTQKVGRVLFNGFPTGVEVTHSMVHGGPYPASTNVRTTSVGSMAIYRFLRPISYQQTPQSLLPEVLKDQNPHAYTRMINGVLTTDAVS